MANKLEFHYVDSAKKQSIDKAVHLIDTIKDVSILSYDDKNIRAVINDVSSFAHNIHVPVNVSELVNDKHYLVLENISNLVSEEELESKNYLQEHQSLDEYAKTINVNTSISNTKIELKNDVSTAYYELDNKISVLSTETDVKFGNTENLIDQKIEALNNDLSATIGANKTTADNNLAYAIERVRADYDASIISLDNRKQNKLTAGVGIAIDENNVVSSTVDTTLFLIVDELPVNDIDNNKIYLLSTPDSVPGNIYTEHLHTENGWEKLGQFKANTDLSGYYRKTEIDDLLSDASIFINERLSNEVSNLTVNDNLIIGNINAINNRIDSSLSVITNNINANAANISTNSNAISRLDTSVLNNAAVSNNLNNRIADLESKESNDIQGINDLISDNISNIDRHENAINSLNNNLATEIENRITADNANKALIDAETAAREIAIEGINSTIADNMNALNAKDAEIDSSINDIKNSLSNIDTSINAIVANNIDPINTKINDIDASIIANDASIMTNASLISSQAEIIDDILTDMVTLKNTVSGIPKFSYQVVDTIPTPEEAEEATIYLYREKDEPGDMFTEYILVDGYIEKLGYQNFNIENYATTEYVTNQINSIENNFVNADDQAAIDASIIGNLSNVNANIETLQTSNNELTQKINSVATEESLEIVQQVSNNAEAIANDASIAVAAMQSQVNSNADNITNLSTRIDGVDTSIGIIEDKLDSIDDEIQGLATKTYVNEQIAAIPTTDLTGYATENYVNEQIAAIPATDLTGYATENYVNEQIAAIPATDLSGYATENYVNEQIAAIPATDLSGYATENYVNEQIAAIPATDLTNYVTKDEIGDLGDREPVEGHDDYWIYNGETYDQNPTYEVLDTYEVINDEESWNESYSNGVLKAYYTKYPDEDLLSTDPETPDKTAEFNDRIYVGTIDDNETVIRFKAGWLEKSQSITNIEDSTEVYYMERLDKGSQYYGTDEEWRAQYATFHGKSWTLYTDAALTQEAGKTFNITTLEFEGFDHSYSAWIANGAKTPWICVNFMNEDTDANILFRYEGIGESHPWPETIFGNGEGHKAWGIASLPTEFGNEEATDPSKLTVLIEHQGVEYFPAEDAHEGGPHTVKSYTDSKYDDLLAKYNALLARVKALENSH